MVDAKKDSAKKSGSTKSSSKKKAKGAGTKSSKARSTRTKHTRLPPEMEEKILKKFKDLRRELAEEIALSQIPELAEVKKISLDVFGRSVTDFEDKVSFLLFRLVPGNVKRDERLGRKVRKSKNFSKIEKLL
jgi:hypothetical protein